MLLTGNLRTLGFESNKFSAKAFYLASEGTLLHRAPFSLVWLGLAPPWVEAFCWLVVVDKVSTVDNLRRRGFTSNNLSNNCVMCGKEESINHLFLHCEVAALAWSNFIQKCSLAWCCPKNIAGMAESWLGGYFIGCDRVLCRMIPFAIL